MPTIPLHQLTAAAADVGRYQAVHLILEHLFTDDERAELVRDLTRRYLPGMPIPDPVPPVCLDPRCVLDSDHPGDCQLEDYDSYGADASAPDGEGADSIPTWHVIRCAMTGERQDPPRDYPYADPIGVAPHGAGLAVVWRYRA